VRLTIDRYRGKGLAGLRDGRRGNLGSEPSVSPEWEADLAAVLRIIGSQFTPPDSKETK